jgi:putative copper resistance protein D
VCGLVFFRWNVAEPAFRKDRTFAGAYAFTDLRFERELQTIFAVALLLIILSGTSWFAVLVATLSERPFTEALVSDDARQVLMATQFGQVWTARLAVAIAMAALISPTGAWRSSIPLRRWLWTALAAVLLGSLAWVGHSGAAPGKLGTVLLANDCLHLLAAGAWAGGLVPLALFLAAHQRHQGDPHSRQIAVTVTKRFSTLGVTAVAVILLTGIVNTEHLVESIRGLAASTYGNLLLAKIALFLTMVAVAAVNRFRLLPRLHTEALRVIQRNALVESALGLLVILIVAVLGTMAPPAHDMEHMDHALSVILGPSLAT